MRHPIPERIERRDDDIAITWSASHVGRYPNRALRLLCPCAGCRHELTGERLLDPANVPADIKPEAVRLVGSYAIRIDWSDGHTTGIYTYELLQSHCPCEQCAGESGSGGATPG